MHTYNASKVYGENAHISSIFFIRHVNMYVYQMQNYEKDSYELIYYNHQEKAKCSYLNYLSLYELTL